MKQISSKYNVPAEIWNRYLQNTMFRLRYEQMPPKYNVPAQIWKRYLQNTMSRLRFGTDTSKIQCSGSDMKQIQGRYCLSEYAVKDIYFYRIVGDVKREDGSKIQNKENLWHVSPGDPQRTKIRTRHFTRAQNAHISLSHFWCSCLTLDTAVVTMLPVRRTVSYIIVCSANVNLFVYATICLTNTTRVSFATN